MIEYCCDEDDGWRPAKLTKKQIAEQVKRDRAEAKAFEKKFGVRMSAVCAADGSITVTMVAVKKPKRG